ncbi:MAG TPA: Lin1244/Lin1753 domain-containing protein, partial [Allocoleopsis sp.]
MKKDTYYFSHDYNASSDAKILFLRQQLGMEGYGIYWFVLEQLVQAGGYLPLKIIPVLAMQCQTQEVKLKAVVTEFDLFQIEDAAFYSERLNNHLQLRKLLSDKGKAGAINRWKNGGAIGEAIAPPNGEGNAKERKGKEIKVKEIKDNIPALDEFLGYAKTICNLSEYEFSLKAKYQSWVESNWKDGNGSKIKNWKTKLQNTIPYLKPFKSPENALKSESKILNVKDRFRSPLLRDGITIQEWVAEFQKEQPDLTKIDLTFINQSCIPNSEKWMKAVMQTWYSK